MSNAEIWATVPEAILIAGTILLAGFVVGYFTGCRRTNRRHLEERLARCSELRELVDAQRKGLEAHREAAMKRGIRLVD